jgi:hypothetical protein
VSKNEHYLIVLEDLKKMKAEAEAGIRAIERLIARSPGDEPKSTPTESGERENGPVCDERIATESVPTRIVQFLGSKPGRSFTAEEIAKALGPHVNFRTVRGALFRLARGRFSKVVRAGRGRYRLRGRPAVVEEQPPNDGDAAA